MKPRPTPEQKTPSSPPPVLRRLLAHAAIAGSAAALLAAAWACSADLAASGASADERGSNSANNGGFPGAVNPNNANNISANNAANNSENNFVPEDEETFDFQAPRSSRNFVFVANTSLDAVAKVDARTLEIVSIEVGDRPTLVETWQPENMAVVLSEGSDELSIIRAGDTSDYVVHLPLPPGLNRLALAPRGDYALVWFDFDRAEADPESDVGDAPPFQDVALVRLEEGRERVFRLTVGFQVLGLDFDDAGEHAYVITRTGISVVDLAEIRSDRAVPPVAVADVGMEDELEREVEVTGDGRYAFVRSGGLQGINIVDLDTHRISLIELSATPTDLDIVPGQSRALAVVRQTNELAVIDLPAALNDPDAVRRFSLGDEPAGLAELTPDARRALVFTSVEERRAITVVDLEDGAFNVYPLRKGVRAVALAPWGDEALIIHTKLPGDPRPGESQDELIAKSWGYSLFDVNTGFSKLETVPTEPGEFLFTEDEDTGAQRLYILLTNKQTDVRQVEIVNMSSLSARSVRLGSPPEHVGFIPNDGDPLIYISQEHPVGRMTFIQQKDDEIRTVTGYQLNSLIE